MTLRELRQKIADLPDDFEVKMCNDEYSMNIDQVEVAPQPSGHVVIWLINGE